MALTTAERPVARRNDVAVKVDMEIARIAKIVAAMKDMSLAEYVSSVLEPIVRRDFQEHAGRVLKSEKTPKRPS